MRNFNPDMTLPVSDLYHGASDSKPVDAEWDSERLMNDEWSYYQSFTVDMPEGFAHRVTAVIDGHGTLHAVRVGPWIFEVEHADFMGSSDVESHLEDQQDEDGALTEDTLQIVADTLTELSDNGIHRHAGGPMMNYWYPLYAVEDAPAMSALMLGSLPLCVVEVDGSWGLALTGGGMDLSWEIAQAFVTLGYLPPTHFSDLPAMSGIENQPHTAYIVSAMIESLTSAAQSATRSADRLREKFSITTPDASPEDVRGCSCGMADFGAPGHDGDPNGGHDKS